MMTIEESIETIIEWVKEYESNENHKPSDNNLVYALEVALPCLVAFEADRQIKERGKYGSFTRPCR